MGNNNNSNSSVAFVCFQVTLGDHFYSLTLQFEGGGFCIQTHGLGRAEEHRWLPQPFQPSWNEQIPRMKSKTHNKKAELWRNQENGGEKKI